MPLTENGSICVNWIDRLLAAHIPSIKVEGIKTKWKALRKNVLSGGR